MKKITTLAQYQQAYKEKQAYKESIEQPEKFWAEVAADFKWKKKWDRVLEWNFTGMEFY